MVFPDGLPSRAGGVRRADTAPPAARRAGRPRRADDGVVPGRRGSGRVERSHVVRPSRPASRTPSSRRRSRGSRRSPSPGSGALSRTTAPGSACTAAAAGSARAGRGTARRRDRRSSIDIPPPAGSSCGRSSTSPGVDALVRVHERSSARITPVGPALLAGLGARAPHSGCRVLALPGNSDLRRPDGVPPRHGLREPLGRRHAGGMAGPGVVPVAGRLPCGAGGGERVSLPQVDASADSRPILRRLGFVELATTTPFTYTG